MRVVTITAAVFTFAAIVLSIHPVLAVLDCVHTHTLSTCQALR